MRWRKRLNPFRRRIATPEASPSEFPLDDTLVNFSPVDFWSVRDSHAGCQICGTIGSGKTSGSGATIARAMLQKGVGGLVLCAKVEEYPEIGTSIVNKRGGLVHLFAFLLKKSTASIFWTMN